MPLSSPELLPWSRKCNLFQILLVFYFVLVCSSFRLALLCLFDLDVMLSLSSLVWAGTFVTGSKYLQSPVSAGSSFHLSFVWKSMMFSHRHISDCSTRCTSTPLSNSLCGAVPKFSDGANGCSSVKPCGARLRVPCEACCSSRFSSHTEGKRMLFCVETGTTSCNPFPPNETNLLFEANCLH